MAVAHAGTHQDTHPGLLSVTRPTPSPALTSPSIIGAFGLPPAGPAGPDSWAQILARYPVSSHARLVVAGVHTRSGVYAVVLAEPSAGTRLDLFGGPTDAPTSAHVVGTSGITRADIAAGVVALLPDGPQQLLLVVTAADVDTVSVQINNGHGGPAAFAPLATRRRLATLQLPRPTSPASLAVEISNRGQLVQASRVQLAHG